MNEITPRHERRSNGEFRFALALAIQGPGQAGCYFVYGFNEKSDVLDFMDEGKNFIVGDSQICGFIFKLKGDSLNEKEQNE